jgi:hypothetical protein
VESTPIECSIRASWLLAGVGGVRRNRRRGREFVMARTRYEVVPEGDQWIVREGKKSTPPLDSKELALEAAIRRAQDAAPSEVVVVHEDGTLEETRTFDGSGGR